MVTMVTAKMVLSSFAFTSIHSKGVHAAFQTMMVPRDARIGSRPGRSLSCRIGPWRLYHSQRNDSSSIRETLFSAEKELNENHVPEPVDSCIHLLSAALGLDYDTGFRRIREVYHDQTNSLDLSKTVVSTEQLRFFKELLERRKQHEPLQYIIGRWDFLDHTFYIEPPLLCPRPETEELVLLVGHHLQQAGLSNKHGLRILDIGAGTGCIGISLASLLPTAKVTAIDLEPNSIHVATKNAKEILGENWNSRYDIHLVSIEKFKPSHRYDVVVSNPPYIPKVDYESLDRTVKDFESYEALCGGEEGLDVVNVILERLSSLLLPGGTCWMEVDPSHPAILKERFRSGCVKEHKDMFGKERFIEIHLSAELT